MKRGQVERALALATSAHKGQFRKYTGEPYVLHPVAVARTVSLVSGATEEMVCAALLHDVLEDTETLGSELARQMGEEIYDLVMELTATADERFTHAPRGERKSYEAARLAFTSPQAQTIKVADLMDNTKTIVAYDPKFAAVYLEEKRALLSTALLKADPLLLHLAREQLDAAFIQLGVLNEVHETRD